MNSILNDINIKYILPRNAYSNLSSNCIKWSQPTYIRRAIYSKLNDFVHLCHFHINKGIQKIGYGMHFSSVGCVKGEQKKTSYILSLPATPSMNCADEHTWDIQHFLNHTTLWTWLLFFSFYNFSVFCELHIVFVWQFFTHNQLWKKVLKKNWSCLSIGIWGRRSC